MLASPRQARVGIVGPQAAWATTFSAQLLRGHLPSLSDQSKISEAGGHTGLTLRASYSSLLIPAIFNVHTTS